MPAKKSVKKAAGKAKKKAAPKKKAAAKQKATSKAKSVAKKKAPVKDKSKPKQAAKPVATPKKEMVECPHCLGTGRCTAGDIFDKDRHQGLFQEQLLTSCIECLTAAGKPRNSKKLVVCRICNGTGEVEKD